MITKDLLFPHMSLKLRLIQFYPISFALKTSRCFTIRQQNQSCNPMSDSSWLCSVFYSHLPIFTLFPESIESDFFSIIRRQLTLASVIRKYCYIASMAVYALKGTPSIPVISHFEINLNKTTESSEVQNRDDLLYLPLAYLGLFYYCSSALCVLDE